MYQEIASGRFAIEIVAAAFPNKRVPEAGSSRSETSLQSHSWSPSWHMMSCGSRLCSCSSHDVCRGRTCHPMPYKRLDNNNIKRMWLWLFLPLAATWHGMALHTQYLLLLEVARITTQRMFQSIWCGTTGWVALSTCNAMQCNASCCIIELSSDMRCNACLWLSSPSSAIVEDADVFSKCIGRRKVDLREGNRE